MKIGILTHFASFQPSYALHVGWIERAKLLQHFGQDFDFLVNLKVPDGLYPNQKNILPNIKTSKPFKERAEFFRDLYLDVLKEYDAVFTADALYQTKGNFLAYNQAIKWASPHLKAKWYHWIHSAWTNPPNPLPPYPENLKYEFPDTGEHMVIYLNSYELDGVAKMFNTSRDNVACIYNPKDPRNFFDLSPLAKKIVAQLKFWEKDVVQIFPHCTTRMESKGIDPIIKVFSALKRKNRNVAIVFANANSRSSQEEIRNKKNEMHDIYGLVENEDFLFTSDWTENFKPLPRKDVADLFKLSNLFVFGSWRETVGNVFQEAKVSGCQLVLNQNLQPMLEMGGPEAIYFQGDYSTPGVRDGMSGNTMKMRYKPNEEEYFSVLADMILGRLDLMPNLRDRWQFCYELIWEKQFKPLLYGGDL